MLAVDALQATPTAIDIERQKPRPCRRGFRSAQSGGSHYCDWGCPGFGVRTAGYGFVHVATVHRLLGFVARDTRIAGIDGALIVKLTMMLVGLCLRQTGRCQNGTGDRNRAQDAQTVSSSRHFNLLLGLIGLPNSVARDKNARRRRSFRELTRSSNRNLFGTLASGAKETVTIETSPGSRRRSERAKTNRRKRSAEKSDLANGSPHS